MLRLGGGGTIRERENLRYEGVGLGAPRSELHRVIAIAAFVFDPLSDNETFCY
jgi:hypothetical protein